MLVAAVEEHTGDWFGKFDDIEVTKWKGLWGNNSQTTSQVREISK